MWKYIIRPLQRAACAAHEMGSALDTDYLIELGAIDQRMLILVDIDKLMSSAGMGLIEKLAA